MDLSISVVLAMVVGYFLKKNPAINNKLIPVIVFLSQFIGRLLLELGVSQAHASVAGALFHGLGIGPMLLQAAFSTLLSVGAHSSFKNVGEGFLNRFKNVVVEKVSTK